MVTTRTIRALALGALAGLAVLVAALTVSALIAGPSSAMIASRGPIYLPAPTLGSGGVSGLFGGRPTADQAAVVAAGSPTAPAVFTLDPEGGDVAQVDVHLPLGVTAMVKVTRLDGTVDATATTTATDTLGEPGYVVQLTGLAGTKRAVTVTPSRSAQTGFTSTVLAGSVSATAAVEAGAAGQPATIRVTVTGLTGPSISAATVEAAWRDGGHRKTMPLIFDATSRQFTARFNPPTGIYVPVDVTLNAGGTRRVLTAGVVVPSESGTIGALRASALVDTNADGRPDVFRIPVNVTVSKAGSYQMVADLSRDGKTALSVLGKAQLQPGSGQIMLDVLASNLLLVGKDGPFQVTSAILTEGSASSPRIVARSDLLGTTGPLSLARLATAKVALSTPGATSDDTDHDGLPQSSWSGQPTKSTRYATTRGGSSSRDSEGRH